MVKQLGFMVAGNVASLCLPVY